MNIRNTTEVRQNGKKNGLFLGIFCGVYIFVLFSYVYMCVRVCLGKEKKLIAGTEKWVEVCGKPWCRPVFVWLGFCSRHCSSRAPDNIEFTLASILSSCSGDVLNWQRLARVVYELCV